MTTLADSSATVGRFATENSKDARELLRAPMLETPVVTKELPSLSLFQADCLEWLKSQPSDSVDLVFCSPPYEAARTYGIDFNLTGQAWVDWCIPRYLECLRVCRGLVAWVVEGQTRKFRYSCAPVLLMADLHREGVHLRKPPIYHRIGIPGSGGPDWLRNDYEFVVCATSGGKLPWSDNVACGESCRYGVGGVMSYRTVDGQRRNDITGSRTKLQSRRKANGARLKDGLYTAPEIANPGNVVHCRVGGGLLGSDLSHENEAPFPESLAEFFIRSFCPPGGVVLDPFVGSGTTSAVAIKCGRRAIGVDIRESQIELASRRCDQLQLPLVI